MLVGFLASPKAANLQYPRGCPVCTKHTSAKSTHLATEKLVEAGKQWSDENGNVLPAPFVGKGKK